MTHSDRVAELIKCLMDKSGYKSVDHQNCYALGYLESLLGEYCYKYPSMATEIQSIIKSIKDEK